MIGWLRERLGMRAADAPRARAAPEWRIDCTLLVPLKVSKWRTLRAGRTVSLPAWQAISLDRLGKAEAHVQRLHLPTDAHMAELERQAAYAPW